MKYKFKQLIQENRWLKLVPNTLTLCNSWCGFAAIVWALHVAATSTPKDPIDFSQYAIGAWLILFAMVFDALDGFTARIFNAASLTGMEMDSLSDMVTFGTAPAVFIATMTYRVSLLQDGFGIWGEIGVFILCGVYLGGAALRLAKYNVMAQSHEHKSSEYFSGIPSPGAAAAVCSIIVLLGYLQQTLRLTESITNICFMLLPPYAALLGVLMCSNVPYIHAGRWLASIRRNKKRLVLLIVILAFLAAGAFTEQFRPAVALLVGLYVIGGLILAICRGELKGKKA